MPIYIAVFHSPRYFNFIQVELLSSPAWCNRCAALPLAHARFCTACGIPISTSDQSLADEGSAIDFIGINKRIEHLDSLLSAKRYDKQKCALTHGLKNFLLQCFPPKNLDCATPEDLRMFLVAKESNGRTKLHAINCTQRSARNKGDCVCPLTLSYKTVDSLIGKIRAIFNDHGRTGDWNPTLGTGNPAASKVLKKHLRSINIEQTAASVVPRQAVPLMFDKLTHLCRYINYKSFKEKDPTSKFLFTRDCAYFSLLSHTGGRGGDIGLLKADRLFELPDDQGLLISQIEGKTAKIDDPNNIVIFRSKDPDICPIRYLKIYLETATQMGVDLSKSFVFRSRDVKSQLVCDKAVTADCMTDRLQTHLKAINLFAGETTHSCRRGLAITLRMLGTDDSSISNHIGWQSKSMLNRYDPIGNLIGPHAAARKLADASQRIGENSGLCDIASETLLMSTMKPFVMK